MFDVYVDGQDKPQAQARSRALADAVGSQPLAYQVLPPDASEDAAPLPAQAAQPSAQPASANPFGDLIPKGGQPSASAASASPSGPPANAAPSTLISVPDERPDNPVAPSPEGQNAAANAFDLAAGFGAETRNMPSRIRQAGASALGSLVDVPTDEQSEAKRLRELAELKDSLTALEAHKDSPLYRSNPNSRLNIDEGIAKLKAAIEEKSKAPQPAAPMTPDQEAFAQGARDLSGAFREVAGDESKLQQSRREEVGLGKADDSTYAKVGMGLGHAPDAMLPVAGPALLVAEARAQAYQAEYDKAKAENPEDETGAVTRGEAAANHAAETTAATLPAYALGGAAAGAAGKTIAAAAPAFERPLARGVLEAGLATGANAATSAGVRAAEGDKPFSLESFLSGDLPLGIIHARNAAASASALRTAERARPIAPASADALAARASAAASKAAAGLRAAPVEAPAPVAAPAPETSAAVPEPEPAPVAAALEATAPKRSGLFDDLIPAKAPAVEQAADTPAATRTGLFDDLIPGNREAAAASAPAPADNGAPERMPVAPVYAYGETPQERAQAFLEPSGDDAPTAALFAPGEAIPDELEHAPRVQTPDGSTAVYDPELHRPEDFMGSGTAAPVFPAEASANAGGISAPADTIAELRRVRDEQQTLLNRSNISAEDARDIQVRVDYFNERIAELSRQSPEPAMPASQVDEQASQVEPDTGRDISKSSAAPADKESAMAGGAGISAGEQSAFRDDAAASFSAEEEHAARLRYQQELEEQAREGIADAGGVELLDALKAAGGLPTDDPVYRGELGRIREASKSSAVAGYKGTFNLFRKSAPKLDELVSRMQSQGFDAQTPGDLLDALERRVTSKQAAYGFPAHAQAQSGMAGAFEPMYRQSRARATPRTPEELLPLARRYREALQRLAPKTKLGVETIRREQLSSLWKGRGKPPGDVHAAYLDNVVYLVHEALEASPERLNRVNFLHETAHAFERALPENARRELRAQWRREIESGESPLHDASGAPRAEVDQRAFDPHHPEAFSEWLAERVAWENEAWAKGEFERAGKSAVGKFAHDLREFIRKLFAAFSPDAAPGELSQSFREWLAGGTPLRARGWEEPQAVVRRDPQLGPVRHGLPPGHPLLRETREIGTTRRERLRDWMVRKTLEGARPVAEGQKPILWLMGGGSGSGKSTVLENLFAKGEIPREGTVRLDSDEIKRLIPEYNTLLHHKDPAASTLSHRESADVLNRAFRDALAMRTNAVLDGTMSYAPHVQKVIAAAREHGYEVRVEGVAIHPQEAVSRARQRARETGRDVPLDDIVERHEGFLKSVESYAPLADRWQLWDNNGSDALPFASSEQKGGITVHDPELYDRFKAGKEYDFQGLKDQVGNAARTGRQPRLQPEDGPGVSGGSQGARGPGSGGREGARLAGSEDAQGDSGVRRAAGEHQQVSPGEGSDLSPGRVRGPVENPPDAPQFALRQKSAPTGEDEEVRPLKSLPAGWKLTQHMGQSYVTDELATVMAHGSDRAAVLREGLKKAAIVAQTQAKLDNLGYNAPAPADAPTPAMPEGWKLRRNPKDGSWQVLDETGAPQGAGATKAAALEKMAANLDAQDRTRHGYAIPPGLLKEPFRPVTAAEHAEIARQMAQVPLKRNPDGDLLAPNGKPSALDERQYRQTRTPFFKRFFGDWQRDPASASKIVDENGEPRVMYRGTDGGNDPSLHPNDRRQIYFSVEPEFASAYGPRMWEAFINARKPWDYKDPEHLALLREALEADKSFRYDLSLPGVTKDTTNYETRLQRLQGRKSHAESVRDAMAHVALGSWETIDRYPVWEYLQGLMKRHGFDGAWISERDTRNLIVPDNRQVKSATLNLGTFDPALEDTRFARRSSVAQGIRNELGSREAKDEIAAGKDAAHTRAAMIARQAGNSVRLDFGTQKELANPSSRASRDLEAMPFVIEAGGNKRELLADLAKVQASADPELAAKYEPVLQHAIANFARLDGLKASYEAIASKQLLIERRHGIDKPALQGHVARVLDLPENQRALIPALLGGKAGHLARGLEFPKLADAIKEGYSPRSTNLADLLEHRIGMGQRLVQEQRLFSRLRATPAPGDPLGRPIIAALEAHTGAGGRVTMRPPLGYEQVDTQGGAPLVVHRQYASLFKALYAESAVRNSLPGRLLLKYAGLAKHGTLLFDTFHVGRVIAKELSFGYQAGYEKGLSLLEYNDRDLARAVAAKDITQAQADYARTHRPAADALIRAGLNVGKVADNLMEQSHSLIEKIPGAGPQLAKFNGWVFGKLSRGAMLQTALTNYARNLERFPELGREGAARRTAREMNEVFGNLQSQGIFKSRTMQDLARTVFLAPQWTESQLRSELRGLGQLGKIPLDLARGRLRVGVIAQGMASNVIALLAANQVVNYLSRGKPTWENPEDDHKLDAWIPGGKRGFFFNPFEIAAENLRQLEHYYRQKGGAVEAAQRLASNKLSPLARAALEALTGRDYSGKPFLSQRDRARAALTDALPFPMPGTSLIEKDPRGAAGSGPVHDVRSAADKALSPLGYRVNRQPGSVERQLIQSAGIKLAPAPSPRSRMYEIAKVYRKRMGINDSAGQSQYTELRRALDDGDMQAAGDELRWLVKEQGLSVQRIGHAMGIDKSGGFAPEYFTGGAETDKKMFRQLSPEERALYAQAQKDHAANARKFKTLANSLHGELSGMARAAR